MKTNTIPATYGSRTPCTLFTAETRRGTWYAVEGSQNVNFTPQEIQPGQDIEELPDADSFTWGEGIDSEETLAAAIAA
jgi:hypothetical protein